MKRIYLYILISVLFLSCTTPKYNKLMKEAETLMYTDVDSAIAVIDEAEFYITGDKDFSRWCLLWGKINNEYEQKYNKKKFSPSLSSWQRAVDYYDKKGTDEERAEIEMYLGLSQSENDLYNEALETYNDALNLALKANNYATAGYVCSYMADLYMDRDLCEEARKKYEENAEYQQKAGNLRSQAIALQNIGFCYILEEKYDNSFSMLHKADSIITILQDSTVKCNILNCYGILYSELGQLDSSELYYLKSLDFDTLDRAITYYNLSDIYTKKEDIETARKYLDKAMSDWTHDVIVHQKYLIAKAENKIDSALFYLEQWENTLDSVRTQQDKMHIIEIDRKYDKNRVTNERNLLLVQLQRLYIAGSTLAALVFVGFVFYRYRVRKMLQQQQDLLVQKESEFRVMLVQLNEKERLLSETDKQSDEFILYRKRVENIGCELYEIKQNLLYNTVIGRKIRKFSKDGFSSENINFKMTEKDWKALETAIQGKFPDAYALIVERLSRPSDDSFRLILLAPFDMRAQEEAHLLEKTEDAVRQNRSRLRKLFNISDLKNLYKPIQDDEFLT